MFQGILKAWYFAAIVAEMIIRAPREKQRRKNRVAVDRVTRQERGLLGLLFLGMFLLPLLKLLTPWLNAADYRLPRWAGYIGMALMSAAVFVFWRSHVDLKQNWSPSLQIREGHALVTHGVYRRIRHPMYASQWIWAIAQPLLLQNWIAGWASLISFIPLYLLRVPREEQLMLETFGASYREYMERTGRVFPRVAGRATTKVKPAHDRPFSHN